MYLILGGPSDPCCVHVNAILKARGCDVRMIPNILSEPQSFSLRFSTGSYESRIGVPGEWEAGGRDIHGVLVRDISRAPSDGRSGNDSQSMSAEMQAALLGWLWSHPGVVINRAPAWLFCRPRPSLLEWGRHLRRAGLQSSTIGIGADETRLTAPRSHPSDSSGLTPTSRRPQFQARAHSEWEGAIRVVARDPFVLQSTREQTGLACVVGEHIIWNDAQFDNPHTLNRRLLSFARSAGLDFVQIAVARPLSSDRDLNLEYVVVSVETHVQFHRFSSDAQQTIAELLTGLLTRTSALYRRPIDAPQDASTEECAQ